MADHEGHLLGRNVFCGDDEIAFVLTVHRIEDDDEFSISYSCISDPFSFFKLGLMQCRRWR